MKRQRVVVIGNCQAEVVASALRHPSLDERFGVQCYRIDGTAAGRDDVRRDILNCDVALVQDISNFDDSALSTAIPASVRIVKFPCLRLSSLWPFDGQSGPDDRDARTRPTNPAMFAEFDGLLGRLRKQVPDKEARLETYRSLAIEGVVNFRRLHELETARLLKLDRQFSCSIGRLILDEFRGRRLFHAAGRPGAELYRLLMQFILDRLDAGVMDAEAPVLGAADEDEVPVHPRVAAALGVTWGSEAATYLFHGRLVRWEDYVRAYIEEFG